jgi:murein DD-endopeptidase
MTRQVERLSRSTRVALGAAALFIVGLALAAPPLHSSFDLQVPLAPAPVPISGETQLVYELHVTNLAEQSLTLTQVQVLDADAGTVLTDLHDAALEARLGRPGLQAAAADRRTLAPGMRAVLYLEVAPGHRVPRALRHRLDYAVVGTDRKASVEGALVAIDRDAPLVLGAPLRGGPWAAIHHPAWPRGHRRMLYAIDGRARIPGRHAIDWILLDNDGHKARGDDDRVDTWYGHGADVLAVADGVIAATRDDVAESASIAGHPRNALEDATGNYVALDLGHGRFAFYEHLKPGSLRVARGDRVRRGQVLAALGFTGDSTGPHLHFHVADANSPLGAEGVPYVFEQFQLLGRYDSLEGFGKERWQAIEPAFPAQRQSERPAPNSVVRFAAEATKRER